MTFVIGLVLGTVIGGIAVGLWWRWRIGQVLEAFNEAGKRFK